MLLRNINQILYLIFAVYMSLEIYVYISMIKKQPTLISYTGKYYEHEMFGRKKEIEDKA